MDEALQQLTGEDAAAAEALILDRLPGKIYGAGGRLAVPGGGHPSTQTPRPGSQAKRPSGTGAGVEMFREQSGAAGLAGRELPTDQTLAGPPRA